MRFRLRCATLFTALFASGAWAAELVVAEVDLNGVARGTLLVLEDGGRFFIEPDDASAWRLRVEGLPRREFAGRSFVSLDGLHARVESFDRARSRIALEAPPDAFEASESRVRGLEWPVTPAGWGLHMGYDLVATRATRVQGVDGALVMSAFSSHGTLDAQMVARNLWSNSGEPRRWLRQSTTYRRDWGDQLISLEAGDTFVRPGANTRALRLGGVWAGTNFALRPGYVTQPLPSFSGEAALPSTVQVFVNNQLRSVSEVPAGPFRLDSVPVLTGAGDARMVVRDALGRETVVNSSFYATSGLLAAGLTQYAAALGRLRRDGAWGVPEYGASYGMAAMRHGMNNALTVEASGELESGGKALFGAAAGFALPVGELEFAGALSSGADTQARGRLAAGYRYQDWDQGIGLRYERSARGMSLPGIDEPGSVPLRQITAFASRRLGARLALNSAYVDASTQDGRRLRSVNFSGSFSLGRQAQVMLSFNRVADGTSTRHGIGVLVVLPFDGRHSVSMSAEGGSDPRLSATAQSSLPMGEGQAWRLAAGRDRTGTRSEAAWIAQLPAATVQADVDQRSGNLATRLQAQGGLVWMGGRLAAMRPSLESFALVEIPGVADAPIMLNNQVIGRTDADGRLLVPGLVALAPSEIKVDATGLPPDAEIQPGRDRVVVVPPLRAGVDARLGVRRVAAAVVRVLDASGQELPAGATVDPGSPELSATAVAGAGEFFISGAPGTYRVRIVSRGRTCGLELLLPVTPPGQAYSKLGPSPCVP